MPTLVILSNTDDGWVFGESAVYATARDTGTSSVDNLAFQQIGQILSLGTYGCHMNLFTFDTSSIPSTATVNSAELYISNQDTPTAIPTTLEARLYPWTTPVDIADFLGGSFQAAQTLLCTLGTGIFSGVMQAYKFAENALTANINKGANTQIAICSDRHRLAIAPTNGVSEIVTVRSADETGTEFDPRLLIEYTLAPAALGGGPLSAFRPMQSTPSLVSP